MSLTEGYGNNDELESCVVSLRMRLEAAQDKIDNLNNSLNAANDRARVYKEKWEAAQAEIERLTEALHGKDCAIAELSSDCERKDKLLEMLYDACCPQLSIKMQRIICDEIKARSEAKGEN